LDLRAFIPHLNNGAIDWASILKLVIDIKNTDYYAPLANRIIFLPLGNFFFDDRQLSKKVGN